MMRTSLAAAVAVASFTSIASADLIFQAGTQTGSRYNPQSSPALPGGFTAANTIAFTNCLFEGGNTSVTLDSFTFGIRQLGGAPTVGIRVFIAQMDGNANLITSSVQDLGLVTVGGAAASATTLVNFNAGGVSLAMADLAGASNPGYSGFYVGIRFEGANATSSLNGWRVTNAPALGASFNQFAAFDPTTSSLNYFAFTAPTPSYFYVDVNGTLVPAPGAVALLGLAGLTSRRRRA